MFFLFSSAAGGNAHAVAGRSRAAGRRAFGVLYLYLYLYMYSRTRLGSVSGSARQCSAAIAVDIAPARCVRTTRPYLRRSPQGRRLVRAALAGGGLDGRWATCTGADSQTPHERPGAACEHPVPAFASVLWPSPLASAPLLAGAAKRVREPPALKSRRENGRKTPTPGIRSTSFYALQYDHALHRGHFASHAGLNWMRLMAISDGHPGDSAAFSQLLSAAEAVSADHLHTSPVAAVVDLTLGRGDPDIAAAIGGLSHEILRPSDARPRGDQPNSASVATVSLSASRAASWQFRRLACVLRDIRKSLLMLNCPSVG